MIVKVKLKNGHALEINCKPEEFTQYSLDRIFRFPYWCVDNFIIRTDEILYMKMEDHNDGD